MTYPYVNNLHGDFGARAGTCFFSNVFEMLLDSLFCQSHFVGDFLIGPAFQEMLKDHCFACGQVKRLFCLDNDGVLPRADPDLAEHDDDSCLRSGLIN